MYYPPMAGRALVLGGGGVTGVAWELGILAGLADAGFDPAAADLYVGTSAGSVVAAQVTSGIPIEELYQRQLAPPDGEISARIGAALFAKAGWAMLRARQGEAFRKRIGAVALKARTLTEAERREVIAGRLGGLAWPDQRLLITACDAYTGAFKVFDADSGVSLVDAVGASCAVPGVWPPVTIGDTRYIDGGMRSPTNADLAEGSERVVVIAPVTFGGGPVGRLANEARLLGRTAKVVTVAPDKPARAAIGRNVLDPAFRAASARAGREQAARVADEVMRTWS
jgi:NTE family protein